MHLYRAVRDGNLWLSGNEVQFVKHRVSVILALFVSSWLTHWHIQTSLRRPGSLGPLTLRLLMSHIYIYIYIYI